MQVDFSGLGRTTWTALLRLDRKLAKVEVGHLSRGNQASAEEERETALGIA